MIDLHCHSHFSDGTDSPQTLVRLAELAGLTALALTDHDTLEGLPEFLAIQSATSVRLIPGIELSCRFMGMELHLLGLFLDPSCPALKQRVEALQRRRHTRNVQMVQQLETIGLPITMKEVADLSPSGVVSRIHFARALVNRGFAGSRQDAFARIIGNGRPGHVPFEDLQIAEAIQWILDADGVPVVAHPGRSTHRGFCWDEAMADLKALGLQGLEACYSQYGPREEAYFLDLAQRLDLAPTGGSDYHGEFKPGLALGVGHGTLAVPDAFLAGVEARKPSWHRP
ncbi:MAG TPA: PHP domain-containing protein [Holophaga sp.]|nr:PHP domain-containing protein [Holophaga sp.]